MYTLDELKRQFLEHIEIEKGRSLKTVENYDHYLTVFLTHTKLTNPKDITPETVREFRLWLNRQSAGKRNSTDTLKRKTQNYYLIALRAFLKFLAKRSITSLPAENIELAKVPERQIDLISPEELRRLFDAPNKEKDPLAKARGKAILELLFSTGLRVSELCSLSRDEDFSRDEISIRGKGGKVRVVFLSDDAKACVKDYLKLRKDLGGELFVKLGKEKGEKEGSGLTPRSVERLVKRFAIIAGVSKKVTPHVIRHCFATDLLRNGADLRSVQMLLGHSNIATTQVYTHVTDQHLREIHKKFHKK